MPRPPPPERGPGYDQVDFDMELADGCFVHCRLEKELPGQGWCCILRETNPMLPSWLNPRPFERFRRIVAREVPPSLLVTCSLSFKGRNYEAIFTTLAGNVITDSYVDSLEPSKLAGLVSTPALAAAQQGRLQSQNQEVCVMLEGKAKPLGVVVVPEFAWIMLEEYERRRQLGEEGMNEEVGPDLAQRLFQAQRMH